MSNNQITKTTCKKCGATLSPYGYACEKCGKHYGSNPYDDSFLAVLFIIIFVAFILVAILGGK